MKKAMTKFKNGAASFYVVAFSTLILVVIATSFATAIVAEVTRTANDDLSQSAYDAALAGIEDAKLAYMNYKNCVKNGESYPDELDTTHDNVTCQDVVYWVKHPNCDMVARILGRIPKADIDVDGGEVLIEETISSGGSGGNNMNQAYTCVVMNLDLEDYQGTLSSNSPYQVIKVRLQDGVSANDIEKVRVRWYRRDGENGLNYSNIISNRVAFQQVSINGNELAAPPTLAVQLIQTASSFTLEELNGAADGARTDRATVYLVPTDSSAIAGPSESKPYNGVYDSAEGENILSATQIASTNNEAKNMPFVVYCPDDDTSDFVCSATMVLPEPKGGNRSSDTFMFVVSLPYMQPETDFSLEFVCRDGRPCGSGGGSSGGGETVTLSSMQVSVDSTGRANDLYRRVEMRLVPVDSSMGAYPFYAIELLGSGDVLDKNMVVEKEWSDSNYGYGVQPYSSGN